MNLAESLLSELRDLKTNYSVFIKTANKFTLFQYLALYRTINMQRPDLNMSFLFCFLPILNCSKWRLMNDHIVYIFVFIKLFQYRLGLYRTLNSRSTAFMYITTRTKIKPFVPDLLSFIFL